MDVFYFTSTALYFCGDEISFPAATVLPSINSIWHNNPAVHTHPAKAIFEPHVLPFFPSRGAIKPIHAPNQAIAHIARDKRIHTFM